MSQKQLFKISHSSSSTDENSPCQTNSQSSVGKIVRVFASPYNPEAIGIVEIERGWGSLRGIEVRIFEGEEGAPLRIVGQGTMRLSALEILDADTNTKSHQQPIPSDR